MNKPSMNEKPRADERGGGKDALVEQAKHAATNAAERAREQASTQLETPFDERKGRAVETIGSVAEAIREGSDKLKGVGPLGEVAERAADRIEDLASFFEGKKAGDIVREVNRIARREPALFVGAAFAIGMIGGRFLKSSARRSSGASESRASTESMDAWQDEQDRYEAIGSGYGSSYGDGGLDEGFLSGEELEYEIAPAPLTPEESAPADDGPDRDREGRKPGSR